MMCVLAGVVPASYAQETAPASAPPVAAPAEAPAVTPPTAAGKPSLEALDRARLSYARGQAAFERSYYVVALAAFQDAYENVPNPIVLVSVGESAAKAGRVDLALQAYDEYLRLRPDAPDHADVTQKRAQLVQSPARLVITSDPAGADIVVDDKVTGQRTPATIEVPPGAHRVSLVLAGYAVDALPVEAGPGAHIEHAFQLQAIPKQELLPSPETPIAAPAAATSVPTAAIVVTSSLGAVGLITGTVLGIAALSARSDYQNNPTADKADQGERLALFADVGFGVGAMALITTAVLLFTHDTPEDVETPGQTAKLSVLPQITPSGASATAKLRF
jgi:tetratricopeptide (TPR) repeat protein